MRFLIDWFRSWFGIAIATREVLALKRKCNNLEHQIRKSDIWMERESKEVEAVNNSFQKALATAQQINRQHEETFQMMRAENTLKTLSLEILTESHTKLLERYRAEVAVEVYKQTAMTVRDHERENI